MNRHLPGKIALVGNAPCELGKGRGDEIDNHEHVLRFNNFVTDGFEKDYGKKITHWVTTFWVDIKRRKDFKGKMICPLPLNSPGFLENYHLQNYRGAHDLHGANELCDHFIPYDVWCDLLLLNPKPSAGLMMIYWLHVCGKIPDITLYGFDFFKNKRNQHYFEKSRNRSHNPMLEKLIVRGIFASCR